MDSEAAVIKTALVSQLGNDWEAEQPNSAPMSRDALYSETSAADDEEEEAVPHKPRSRYESSALPCGVCLSGQWRSLVQCTVVVL